MTHRWTRRLRCPNCQGEFDYELVPGGSFTAVRLGSSRYMRCPLCHRFGLFDLRRSAGPAPSQPLGKTPSWRGEPEPPGGSERLRSESLVPTFSDRRSLVRWSALLFLPAGALFVTAALLPVVPPGRVVLVVIGAALTVGGTLLLLAFAVPDRAR